jgi:hypothetical protein
VARSLARSLRAQGPRISQLRAVCGFDGFVDEMITVVGERQGLGAYTPMTSMQDLGGMLNAAAGRNTLREIVVRSQDAGGCAVNLGDGLCALGVGIDFWGTIGSPIHPAFQSFAARCRSANALGSVYGRTLAFEFGDGKAMFSAVEQLASLDPSCLQHAFNDGRFAADCAAAQVIAFTNWTLYPHMTACWRFVRQAVLSALTHQPWLFLDLVDPSGRSPADVLSMLESLQEFQGATRAVLGLNLTELGVISSLLSLPKPPAQGEALANHAETIRRRLSLAQVVVHHARATAVADGTQILHLSSAPLCEQPLKTTGAGDRFNAGYCLGLMLELDAAERLALGSASGGFFVRHARSGTAAELAVFAETWASGGMVHSAR